MKDEVLFYDGLCNLCHGLVQFILKNDNKNKLKFAQLQSTFAKKCLESHGICSNKLNTIYVFNTKNNRLNKESSAVVLVLSSMGGQWIILATLLWLIPLPIRNVGYRFVAKNRYRWFGKQTVCHRPKSMDRFITDE